MFQSILNVESKHFNFDNLQFYICTKRTRKICYDKTHTMSIQWNARPTSVVIGRTRFRLHFILRIIIQKVNICLFMDGLFDSFKKSIKTFINLSKWSCN